MGSVVECQVRLLRLLLLSDPHASSLLTACCLLPVCGRTAQLMVLNRSCNLPHMDCRTHYLNLSGFDPSHQDVGWQTVRGTYDAQLTHRCPRGVDIVNGAMTCTR